MRETFQREKGKKRESKLGPVPPSKSLNPLVAFAPFQ